MLVCVEMFASENDVLLSPLAALWISSACKKKTQIEKQ